jgi:VIT1/CCC1 family predicted Fe2+/Mn2+ transporter
LAIYSYLKQKENNPDNKRILELIINDEKKHYEFLKQITQKDFAPNKLQVYFYIFLVKLFGLQFILKLMEKREKLDFKTYKILSKYNNNFNFFLEEEKRHRLLLVSMLRDKRLEYVGSFVLGLNDALIGLSSTLAGLTLSLPNTKLIAFVGLISGIAASLSMFSSEYISTEEEHDIKRSPFLAGLSTGIAYFLTSLILVMPYFLLNNSFIALIVMLLLGWIIIIGFSFYVSVVKDISFKQRCLKMIFISFGISTFNFLLGYAIKLLFNIDI